MNEPLDKNTVFSPPGDAETQRLARAREMGFKTDLVLYHGTSNNFDAFEPGRVGMIYLTPQRDYAEQYGEVGEYYVNPGRVFDMINNPEHRQKAIDMFNERGGWTVAYEEHGCFSEEDMEARGHDLNFNPEFDEHWEIIDNPETDIISDLKQEYDTIIMEEWSEHGHTSYALSDPSRIRSIHDSFLPEPESVNPGASSVERFEARLRQVSGADLDASDSVDASPKGPRL